MKRITSLLGCLVLISVGACAADVQGVPQRAGSDAGPDATSHGNPSSGTPDICGNGMDDNGNGMIDEQCTCTPGKTQPCWPGDPKKRHQGACKDGVQTCGAEDSEFPKWGDCVGAVLNCGVDAGTPDAGTPDAKPAPDAAPPSPDAYVCVPHAEICNNGKDEDCDGLVDCKDPDCASDPACKPACVPAPENCGDGKDNDCDGKVDCDDSDCANATQCQPACVPWPDWEVCNDGKDNDCDGKTDCDDPDCAGSVWCTCTESCTPGSWRWCDEAQYCHWGAQICGPDSQWGSCYETNERPPGCGDWLLYDRDCCVGAGQCCQDWPDYDSVGICAPINVTCHSS